MSSHRKTDRFAGRVEATTYADALADATLAGMSTTRRQSLAKLTTLLNCSRPDLPPQSLLVSALTGAATASICVVLSIFSNEAATIRGFLAAGVWLAAPYAIFKAAGRIEKGAKVLFAGGDPVLLALGFHDRRLAVGLTGGTVLHALASMAGILPVLVLIGTAVYTPIGRLTALAASITFFTLGMTALFAAFRLIPAANAPKAPRWSFWLNFGYVILAIGLSMTVIDLSMLSDPFGLITGLFIAFFGSVGLHAAYVFAIGEPIPFVSYLLPVLVGLLAFIRASVLLSMIPEGERTTKPSGPSTTPNRVQAGEAVEPADVNASVEQPPRELSDAAAGDKQSPASAGCVPETLPARSVVVSEAVGYEVLPDVPDGPDGGSTYTLSQPSDDTLASESQPAAAVPPRRVATDYLEPTQRVVPPKRRTSERGQRSPSAALSQVPAAPRQPAVDPTLRRRSVRWPDSDIYREWNRRIFPIGSGNRIFNGVLLLFAALALMAISAGFAFREWNDDLGTVLLAFFWIVAVPAIATAAYGAVLIPRRLLSAQLTGGTEALVLAGITPRMLIRRAIHLALALGVGTVLAISIAWLIYLLLLLNVPNRYGVRIESINFTCIFGILAVIVAFAITIASTLGAIWRSSELTRTVLLLSAIAFAPVAAVVMYLLVVLASREFVDDRNLQQAPAG